MTFAVAARLIYDAGRDVPWKRKGCLMEIINLGKADGETGPQLPRSSMRGRRQLRTR
jgi:hypothetical protein